MLCSEIARQIVLCPDENTFTPPENTLYPAANTLCPVENTTCSTEKLSTSTENLSSSTEYLTSLTENHVCSTAVDLNSTPAFADRCLKVGGGRDFLFSLVNRPRPFKLHNLLWPSAGHANGNFDLINGRRINAWGIKLEGLVWGRRLYGSKI